MAADILPFAASRQAPDPDPRQQGRMTLDLDGAVSPLRGKLPATAGSFAPAEAAPPLRRGPAEAILVIGRRVRPAATLQAATFPPATLPARPRMPRKHKLMLLTAAAGLYTGSMEGRRHFKPRGGLVEGPQNR
ncbi:hypothetical protein SQ03_27635, partial [Methylobacterium platani JCM 14648]